MNDSFQGLMAFADLARQTLGCTMAILGRDLKPSLAMGWLSLPMPVASSYDSLLYGGELLSCAAGQVYEFTEQFSTRFAVLLLPDVSHYAVLDPYLPDSAIGPSTDRLLTENGIAPGGRAEYLALYIEKKGVNIYKNITIAIDISLLFY